MMNEFTATTKQIGLELIDMSKLCADKMETWSDVLARNPESVTAKISSGFITKPTSPTLEFVIDVQTPPDMAAVLRTWAIETKTNPDGTEYFNNIQLTFEIDTQQAADLVGRGGNTTRDDIRRVLNSPTSRLARLTVSNKSGENGIKQTQGERYDFTAAELRDHENDAAKIAQALQEVLHNLKQTITG